MARRPAVRRAVGVPRITDVDWQVRNDNLRWWGFFTTLMLFVLIVGVMAYSNAPQPFSIAFVVLVGACVAAFLRPTIGVYLLVFLTLVGDAVTTSWWPFTKNMSSKESVFFVSDGLILNPLEVLMAVTAAGWLLQRLVDPTWRFWRGRLFWPLAVFTCFVVLGLLRGKVSGSDTRIAIFEFRPLLYMVLVYVLVTNLLENRLQYRLLVLMSMVAVSIQSIFSLVYYSGLPDEEREVLESLSEHSATIHMNALFVFALSLWMLRGTKMLRWMMVVLSVPVVWAYLLSQRRAAMISLFVGIVVVLIVLFHRRRRAFWFVTPTLVVVGVVFLAGTWNAVGAIGLPAQAVKTVLFPEQLAEADTSSDLYREIEKFNLAFTIRQDPLFGVGFGRKFLTPLAMPDISFFEFWEYLPHNSVLWVWLKTGFFGFAAMLFLFARAVQRGMRSALLVRIDEQAAVVLVGLTYAAMFVVFAYVDIAWDIRSTVFLGVAFALCADYEAAFDARRRKVNGVHGHQLESVMS